MKSGLVVSWGALPVLLMGLAWQAPTPSAPLAQPKVNFAREVLPIFKASCFPCHGPTRRNGGLRLSNREEALKGGISGAVIIPGNAEASLLIKRIISDELGPRMPKGMTALSPDQIETLKRWINEGAEWPEGAENAKHWAFIKPERPPIPTVKNRAWVRNPIDAFIMHRLEQEGLKPSPEAPKEVLIRRVYLDLVGLPPSPEAVDAFLRDKRPDAYERLVDRLLASPHYGERQARIWLDLARYADTDGYEKDLRRSIWRYRDWVIDAFHRDMPFDQFTIEQIAGDLLPNPTLEQRIATGFHRNTMQNLEGGVDQAEAHFMKLVDRVDTTATVWLGITLGCARCHDHKYDPITQRDYYAMLAFFNNSKIYPVGDANIGEEKWLEAKIPAPLPEQQRHLEALEKRLAQLRQRYPNPPPWQTLPVVEFKALRGSQLQRLSDGSLRASGNTPPQEVYRLKLRLPPSSYRAIRIEAIPDEAFPKQGSGRATSGNFVLTGVSLALDGKPVRLRRAIADFVQDGFDPNALVRGDKQPQGGWAIHPRVNEAHALWLLFEKPFTLHRNATLTLTLRFESQQWAQHVLGRFRIGATGSEALNLLEAEEDERLLLAQIPTTLVMEDNPQNSPLKAPIRIRGEFTNPGEEVEAGTPAVLNPFPADAPRNRLGLAQWLVSRENPLTARVQVNRMWEACFGRGLVETSDNFGTQGSYPTHPELLDWLAVEFMERGWSVKSLYRLIVTSATYRQSSRITPELLQRDPKNTLYARGPRHRLEAELIRDNALAIGGLLSRKIGGPSVFPYQPEGVWDIPFNADRWTMSEGQDRYRRGIYTFWRRSAPYPSFVAFDATSREVCTANRPRTNTPMQALVLLNDPVYLEAAQGLAKRMRNAAPHSLEKALQYGFRCCTARYPQPQEMNRLRQLYHRTLAHFRRKPEACRKLVGSDDAPLAALTMVAHVMLNLDETITKE